MPSIIICNFAVQKPKLPMKRLIARIALSAALLIGAFSPVRAAEKSVGVLGGVSTDQTAPVAGVFFGLEVIPHLRLTPSITYQFEKSHTDAFRICVDVQSPWRIVGSRFRVYPLAGVSVSRFNVDKSGDNSHSVDRLGFNVGGGLEWQPSAMLGLRLYAEGKYAYARRFDTALVSVGIGYVF